VTEGKKPADKADKGKGNKGGYTPSTVHRVVVPSELDSQRGGWRPISTADPKPEAPSPPAGGGGVSKPASDKDE
jgi:hypothetical protein